MQSLLSFTFGHLVKIGKQNEIPIFAGGGAGKNGNLAANAAALSSTTLVRLADSKCDTKK